MLYRRGVQYSIHFFYKEAFYGANLFPHCGNNETGMSEVVFVCVSFFFSRVDKEGKCLCVCFCANDVVTFFIVLTQALKKWVCTQKHLQNA